MIGLRNIGNNLSKCAQQTVLEERCVPSFALPNHNGIPARTPKCCLVLFVACRIPSKFRQPPRGACFRSRSVAAAAMAMPETAMDKYDSAMLRQNDIWSAGEFFVEWPVDGKTIPKAMQQASNNQLRFCIAIANSTHVPTATSWRKRIDHRQISKSVGSPSTYVFFYRTRREFRIKETESAPDTRILRCQMSKGEAMTRSARNRGVLALEKLEE